MVKITLDAETFKALASTTRLTVLRALDQRRKTLTELSRDLDLNKATIHEHLQLLTAADLIRKRDDEGRKWIYYELTWRGQRLLHPQETTTFNVLLGLGLAAAGGGVTMLGRALGWWLQSHPSVALAGETAGDTAGTHNAAPAGQTQSGTSTGGSSNAPPPASPNGAAQDSALPAQTKAPSGPAPEHHSFLDDGGLIGIILVCMTALFVVLALVLRREVKPGRFNPQAAAAAEQMAPAQGANRPPTR
ncbi:MAG: helix-turn-helix domain-containing protein [bacterium]